MLQEATSHYHRFAASACTQVSICQQSAHVIQELEQRRVVCCDGCANAKAAHRPQRILLLQQSLLLNLRNARSFVTSIGVQEAQPQAWDLRGSGLKEYGTTSCTIMAHACSVCKHTFVISLSSDADETKKAPDRQSLMHWSDVATSTDFAPAVTSRAACTMVVTSSARHVCGTSHLLTLPNTSSQREDARDTDTWLCSQRHSGADKHSIRAAL